MQQLDDEAKDLPAQDLLPGVLLCMQLLRCP